MKDETTAETRRILPGVLCSVNFREFYSFLPIVFYYCICIAFAAYANQINSNNKVWQIPNHVLQLLHADLIVSVAVAYRTGSRRFL